MPTIAQLDQRHPSIELEDMRDLAALYDGDKPFRDRLHRFLPQRPAESPQTYLLRKNEYHYRNYLGAIVDYFAAMLFTSRPVAVAKDKDGEPALEPDEFYEELREDCDRIGGDVDSFFKARLTEAMVYRCAWFSVEQPTVGSDEEEPKNKLEYEARKLGDCWLRSLPFEDVYDWETDEAGNLAWVVTHTLAAKRGSIGVGRGQVVETWDHIQPDKVDTYRIEYEAGKRPEPEKTEVALAGSRAHKFGRTPVICLQLPVGLWAANRLKTPQLAHFRAINAQTWGISRTCYAMPVFKVKDREAFNQTLGQGFAITIEPDEFAEWMAPPSAHFAALDTEIKSQKDEIFRLAHQMALGVENNAAAVGRTAESKSQDAQSTRVILTAYARVVKEVIELAYDMISACRGDDLTWSVAGFDDFAGIDTGGLVTLCTDLQAAGGVPSKTFNAELKAKLAESVLPDIDEATKAVIRDEIKDSIENEPTPEEKELQQFAAMHEVIGNANPAGDRPGGGGKSPFPPKGGKRGAPPAPKPKKPGS